MGIGTSTPVRHLEISGDDTKVVYVASGFGNSWIDSSPMFVGRKARGSSLAPAAVLKDDALAYVGEGVRWCELGFFEYRGNFVSGNGKP